MSYIVIPTTYLPNIYAASLKVFLSSFYISILSHQPICLFHSFKYYDIVISYNCKDHIAPRTHTNRKKIKMAPSATSPSPEETVDITVMTLRKTLCSESAPLALRFRALFSLKHLACIPSSPSNFPAIEAIAAAFASPSALLKHELAYCLGQTRNLESSQYLRAVLENREEDTMVRHEAAEALGALGDRDCLSLLQKRRDDMSEPPEVRETCELSVQRIEWEHSETRKAEKLRQS